MSAKKQAALQALHDLITSKRYRAWQKTLERIMFKYVELCVDMRKGRYAKDGLIQYRIVCQQVNVSSLEEVIKYFMQLATERAEQAKNQAEALEDALDVEDLEADKRPEDLMLSYVSGEKGKDRSDRELVTPWFKFLWETYRTVLEILRNNSKLEALYAMTAHRAFQFCKQYKRTTEFRRLCEIIRNHLANLNKYRDQRDRPDLTAPESLQLYLDTRMDQLKIATDLELWQEAFRSVEDIHGLMSMVKKQPKPSLMVVYYARLTEIFRVSESHLYHAYAWLKLFTLQKSYNKNLTQKDLQLLASSVLLAALSVTPYDHLHGSSHVEIENEKKRNLRMASLISFNVDPKKKPEKCCLAKHSSQNCILESFQTWGKLAAASSVPEVQLSLYIPYLENLTALRVLQQVSKVYNSIKIETLSKMIPFMDFSAEKISVNAVKYKFVAMVIDHQAGAVKFGDEDIESVNLCDHLTSLADSLNKARSMIYHPLNKQSRLGDSLFGLADRVEKEHKRVLARKSIIEKRKEEHERQMLEREREEESKRLKQQKTTEEAEQRRLAEEYTRREEQRIRREIEERERLQAEALILQKGSKKKGKGFFLMGFEAVILWEVTEKVSKEALIEMAMSEHLKERQEMEKKLARLAKTMDYMERAKREEEAPLIVQAFQQGLVEERLIHERMQRMEIELSRQHHAGDLQEKNRLSRMVENKGERVAKLREEEEARKHEEEERRKREEAERKAKLDEMAERQRQRDRELEEKERMRRETLPGKTADPLSRPATTVTAPRPMEPVAVAAAASATATAPAPGKYVPKFRREGAASTNPSPEPDRWRGPDERPPQSSDKWRTDDRDRRSTVGSRFSSSSSSWSSSRNR
ncbi:hypothetical protein HPP92_005565 [Vanilla planifolia]|uniref:Eukaryotic translation initiation factor 3 subunit A n=1 Tax=Vanilla planifolia TaxID=51239 RepID=A0A835RLX5_VANPL|nr:hypothetical protein HPP92_005565 [Vanilla planifolia]